MKNHTKKYKAGMLRSNEARLRLRKSLANSVEKGRNLGKTEVEAVKEWMESPEREQLLMNIVQATTNEKTSNKNNLVAKSVFELNKAEYNYKPKNGRPTILQLRRQLAEARTKKNHKFWEKREGGNYSKRIKRRSIKKMNYKGGGSGEPVSRISKRLWEMLPTNSQDKYAVDIDDPEYYNLIISIITNHKNTITKLPKPLH